MGERDEEEEGKRGKEDVRLTDETLAHVSRSMLTWTSLGHIKPCLATLVYQEVRSSNIDLD